MQIIADASPNVSWTEVLMFLIYAGLEVYHLHLTGRSFIVATVVELIKEFLHIVSDTAKSRKRFCGLLLLLVVFLPIFLLCSDILVGPTHGSIEPSIVTRVVCSLFLIPVVFVCYQANRRYIVQG
jgi:Cu/Ag efflux pump CusA